MKYSALNVICPWSDIFARIGPLPAIRVLVELASKSANCVFSELVIAISLSVKVCRNTVEEGQQQPFVDVPANVVTVERVGFVRPEEVRVVRTEPWKRDTIIQSAEIFFLVVSIKCPLVPLALSLLLALRTPQTMMFLVPPFVTTLYESIFRR